jgi:hypothetical protein
MLDSESVIVQKLETSGIVSGPLKGVRSGLSKEQALLARISKFFNRRG